MTSNPISRHGARASVFSAATVSRYVLLASLFTATERAKNRTKSRVRSKVEHVFGVMKLKFGFVKVRYRGLKKNANRFQS